MQKTLPFVLTILSLSLQPALGATFNSQNPFFKASTLPLEAPAFDKIKDTDYQAAIEAGMKEQLAEINVIANNPAPPTFDNTLVAMEKSGRLLERSTEVFFALTQANTNKTLDNIQTIEAPKLAAHHDAIFLNEKLFMRVKTLYDQREQLHLNPEEKQLLTVYYQQFIHAGANLNEKDKTTLRSLNKKLANLETAFQQKLIAGTKAGELVITNKADLIGLSDKDIAAITQKKNGKTVYVISLQNTTQQPLLSSLENRSLREKLFNASWIRTEKNNKNDTRQLIATIAQLRAQKAALLGYTNYAAYTLYDQMAQTPEAVNQFLQQLTPPTAAKTTADANEIQTMMSQTDKSSLKPWDWEFYAEKIRQQKFSLDQDQIKPYFELDNVLKNGVFYAANQLYGITFNERHDLPVYQPDVRVFDVMDKDGSQLGLIYVDYFKRDNKAGGAWMNNFVQQSTLLGTKPVVYNVCNFTKPAKGEPALLTSDDVTTMFHEFGHALHGLFAHNQYPLTNTNIARDFVEFPSQFNEHWAFYPTVLKHYAVHYQTGKPLPSELADKIKAASTFNQGYSMGEILAASQLDMQWHELTNHDSKQNVDSFEQQALIKTHTNFANVPPRYRSSYFLHIWANGYEAGYYAYLWSEMLDDAAFSWFTEHGGLTRANGDRFREMVLSHGHREDYRDMFAAFYGKDPTIEPMLKHRGI